MKRVKGFLGKVSSWEGRDGVSSRLRVLRGSMCELTKSHGNSYGYFSEWRRQGWGKSLMRLIPKIA